MSTPLEEAQQRLADQLIACGDVWSQPLIEAFRRTPRHCFLDRVYDYQKANGCWHEISTATLGPSELALIYADRVLTTRLSEDAGKSSGVAISSSSQPSRRASSAVAAIEYGRRLGKPAAATRTAWPGA